MTDRLRWLRPARSWLVSASRYAVAVGIAATLAGYSIGTYRAEAAVPVCPSDLAYGDTIECGIDVPHQVRTHSFAGQEGEVVRLRFTETSGDLTPYGTVFAPGGVELCTSITGDVTCTLNTTGVHTVLMEDFLNGAGTGTYYLHLQRLSEPPVGCTNLVFGALPLAGTVDVPAQTNCYQFPGKAGETVRVSVARTSGDGLFGPDFTIYRPDGTVLRYEHLGSASATLDVDGWHSILVYAFVKANTGSYDISLTCLTPGGCGDLPTRTATPTQTPSPTVTATPTETPTPTTTHTPTATPTLTPVPSVTRSPTPSETPAPSASPTPTETATSTLVSSATRSPTATATPSLVASATPTPTATATQTPGQHRMYLPLAMRN